MTGPKLRYEISREEARDLVVRVFAAIGADLDCISGEAMSKLTCVLAVIIASAPSEADRQNAINEVARQLPAQVEQVRAWDILRGENLQ
jgi:hypothetical protein